MGLCSPEVHSGTSCQGNSFFETRVVLCLSVDICLASYWRWGFLGRTQSTPPEKMNRKQDTECWRDKERLDWRREKKKWKKTGKRQLEMRWNRCWVGTEQDLFQSLGHLFSPACVLLKPSLGLATLSGPKMALRPSPCGFDEREWSCFSLGPSQGGALQLRILTRLCR